MKDERNCEKNKQEKRAALENTKKHQLTVNITLFTVCFRI